LSKGVAAGSPPPEALDDEEIVATGALDDEEIVATGALDDEDIVATEPSTMRRLSLQL
jgi:hypothetical protein